MACFSAEEVANMFQNGTVDEILDKFEAYWINQLISIVFIY